MIFESDIIKLLFKSQAVVLAKVDESGEMVFVNSATSSMFGYVEGELTGESIDTLVPDRFVKGHVAFRKRFAENPNSPPVGLGREILGKRKDGSEFRITSATVPFVAEKVPYMLVIMTEFACLV